MDVTYTVDPETITFSEWQDGEEVGSGGVVVISSAASGRRRPSRSSR